MARIAVGGFQHETNSFVPHRADFAHFATRRDRPPLLRGPQVIGELQGGSYALSGFLAELGARHESVPLAWASGGAGGIVTEDAFERILGEIAGRLSEAMPVDAVYLDLHGAMVSEGFEDAEGEMVRRIRAILGEAAPLVVSLDYHANVSPLMVAATDAMLGFRTYPHVDRPETGRRAARAIEALLARGRPAGRALRHLPFLIPVECQCTLVEPSAGIVARSRLNDGEIVTLSYLAGFPSADAAWCGPSVVAHGWTQAAADAAADTLAAEVAAREDAFLLALLTPQEAVARAIAIAQGASRPVIIGDTQDNPGAGGSGDTTGLLKALIAAGADGAALGFLCDAEAAAAAHAAGQGAVLRLGLGGRSGPAGVTPAEAEWTVLRLGDGRFRTIGHVAGGMEADLGPMALLRTGGVSVVVTSRRMQAYDPAPFHHLGLDPARQRILVLKSSCHFRADFEPMAECVLMAAAPGGHVADPALLPFRRLRPGVRRRPGLPAP